jgi:hypothetical protein
MKDQRAGWPAAPSSAEAGGACAAAAAATADVSVVAALRFIEDTALLCEQAGHPRMAGCGLKLVGGHPEKRRARARVREMRDFYEFYEQGLRELVARWKEREEREGT